MSSALRALLSDGRPSPEAIDAFMAVNEFPLVEGPHVTFVFRGHADQITVRHWVYGLESGVPMERVYDTDLWTAQMELPPKSRIEYKLEVRRGDRVEWIQDPLNPYLAPDPFGANSICRGYGYERPEWTLPNPETRKGSLVDMLIGDTPFGSPRKVTVYMPARYRPKRRYPLLIVHDGGDYLHYASLKAVLDNLIHNLEVAPLIAALVHPGDRLTEYAHDRRHAQFIAEHLVPRLERQLPILRRPSARGLMGASFGGVASLSTAWTYPDMFGRLLLQSGSFAFTDIGRHRRGPVFDRVVDFVNAFRRDPGKPSERVFVSCGTYESLIYENRSMVPFLQDTGMQVRYEESRDGHNWENWRDRLRSGLSWLFPGPLWMVYE